MIWLEIRQDSCAKSPCTAKNLLRNLHLIFRTQKLRRFVLGCIVFPPSWLNYTILHQESPGFSAVSSTLFHAQAFHWTVRLGLLHAQSLHEPSVLLPHEPGIPGAPSAFQFSRASYGKHTDVANQRKGNRSRPQIRRSQGKSWPLELHVVHQILSGRKFSRRRPRLASHQRKSRRGQYWPTYFRC